jgi:hypothetical protein
VPADANSIHRAAISVTCARASANRQVGDRILLFPFFLVPVVSLRYTIGTSYTRGIEQAAGIDLMLEAELIDIDALV